MPTFSIRGHEVHFPHQPYGVQFSFMEKMLRTLNEGANALLEAPTGCGKTLSLLCAALAWQEQRKKELRDRKLAKLTKVSSPGEQGGKTPRAQSGGAYGDANDDDDFLGPAAGERKGQRQRSSGSGSASGSPEGGAAAKGKGGIDDDDLIRGGGAGPMDVDFGDGEEEEEADAKPPRIYFATRTHSQIAQVVRELKRSGYQPAMAILAAKQHYCINKQVLKTGRVEEECDRLMKEEQFGCRFKGKPGGKARVNVQVHDIEELSTACRKATTCPYFAARDLALEAELVFCPYTYLVDPVVRSALGIDVSNAVLIFDEAHNIEDVCREGASLDVDLDALREAEAAFRLSAQLTGRADLYGPLGDAAGAVVRWLATHEDSAAGMAPAGFEEHEAVMQGQQLLSTLDGAGLGPTAVGELWRAYELAKAFEEKATFASDGDAASEAVPADVKRPGAGGGPLGTISRLLTVLRLMYAPAPTPAFASAASAAASAPPPAHVHAPRPSVQQQPPPQHPAVQPHNHAQQQYGLGSAVPSQAGGFFPSQGSAAVGTVHFGGAGGSVGGCRAAAAGAGGPAQLQGQGQGMRAPVVPPPPRDNTGDYRLVVRRWIAHKGADRRKARSRMRRDADDGDGLQPAGPSAAVGLSLWCLNPGVAFRSLAEKAHSVVLTSGTLAPLDSFASELGAEFHVRLEAPHVVDMAKQVWAGVLPRGPGGTGLSATFKETARFEFQDEAGEAVLRACQIIPDGVLLFLPSYGLLDKLVTRWKSTRLWERLGSCKTLVVEGREAGKGFEEAMGRYYEAVRAGRGALFFAVCRGKASEGIDFADQHARGVILLGIPFPAVKDTKVRLKKEYNDAGSGPGSGRAPPHRLLSGSAWYSQQAFRALNQAVGRCIRHKYDWGAIVLLDERFRGGNNQQQLSRWVRAAVKVHDNFEHGMASLASFYQGLAADPPKPPPPAAAAAPPPDTAGGGGAGPSSGTSAAASDLKPWVANTAADATGSGKGRMKQQQLDPKAMAAAAAAATAAAGTDTFRRVGKGGKKGGSVDIQYEEHVVEPGAEAAAWAGGGIGDGKEQQGGKAAAGGWRAEATRPTAAGLVAKQLSGGGHGLAQGPGGPFEAFRKPAAPVRGAAGGKGQSEGAAAAAAAAAGVAGGWQRGKGPHGATWGCEDLGQPTQHYGHAAGHPSPWAGSGSGSSAGASAAMPPTHGSVGPGRHVPNGTPPPPSGDRQPHGWQNNHQQQQHQYGRAGPGPESCPPPVAPSSWRPHAPPAMHPNPASSHTSAWDAQGQHMPPPPQPWQLPGNSSYQQQQQQQQQAGQPYPRGPSGPYHQPQGHGPAPVAELRPPPQGQPQQQGWHPSQPQGQQQQGWCPRPAQQPYPHQHQQHQLPHGGAQGTHAHPHQSYNQQQQHASPHQLPQPRPALPGSHAPSPPPAGSTHTRGPGTTPPGSGPRLGWQQQHQHNHSHQHQQQPHHRPPEASQAPTQVCGQQWGGATLAPQGPTQPLPTQPCWGAPGSTPPHHLHQSRSGGPGGPTADGTGRGQGQEGWQVTPGPSKGSEQAWGTPGSGENGGWGSVGGGAGGTREAGRVGSSCTGVLGRPQGQNQQQQQHQQGQDAGGKGWAQLHATIATHGSVVQPTQQQQQPTHAVPHNESMGLLPGTAPGACAAGAAPLGSVVAGQGPGQACAVGAGDTRKRAVISSSRAREAAEKRARLQQQQQGKAGAGTGVPEWGGRQQQQQQQVVGAGDGWEGAENDDDDFV